MIIGRLRDFARGARTAGARRAPPPWPRRASSDRRESAAGRPRPGLRSRSRHRVSLVVHDHELAVVFDVYEVDDALQDPAVRLDRCPPGLPPVRSSRGTLHQVRVERRPNQGGDKLIVVADPLGEAGGSDGAVESLAGRQIDGLQHRVDRAPDRRAVAALRPGRTRRPWGLWPGLRRLRWGRRRPRRRCLPDPRR